MRDDALLAEIGRRLRAARNTAHLSLEDVADRSGVSKRYIRMAEKGDANLSLLKLAALARSLRQPLGELCDIDLATAPEHRVALIGLRGAGKTTVGRALAQRLEVPFTELDELIAELAGMDLAELFTLHGEPYYRELQREALERWLSRTGAGVLAPGGSIVTDPVIYERLRQTCRTVWLSAAPADHWRRVVAQGDTRPMSGRPRAMEQLRMLLNKRRDLYAQAALTVDTSHRDTNETCSAILEWLEE